VDRINDGKEDLVFMSTGVGAPLSRVIFDSLGQKELIRMTNGTSFDRLHQGERQLTLGLL